MTPRTLALLALVALQTPAFAQDARGGDDGWVYEPPGQAGDDGSGGIDASGSVSLETFQAPLAPHGQWIDVDRYGTVWRPSVAPGWRPYHYGRWEWTTEGWLWVSDEPFGWATYHYGRWAWERGLGWIWVPGYQWAPAWVSWRTSGDVVGWAPLAPGLSVYVTDFAFVDFWWTFVPTARFCGYPAHHVAYAPTHAYDWYRATRPAPPVGGYPGRPPPPGAYPGRPVPPGAAAPGRPAWGGPAPRLVEERSGRSLRPARIVTASSPGERSPRAGVIGVYRPEVRPTRTNGRGRGWDDAIPGGRGGAPSGGAPGAWPGYDDRGGGSSHGGRGAQPGYDRGGGKATGGGRSVPPSTGGQGGRDRGGWNSAPSQGGGRSGGGWQPQSQGGGRGGGSSPAPSRGGGSSGGGHQGNGGGHGRGR
jgi:hypothetical protein